MVGVERTGFVEGLLLGFCLQDSNNVWQDGVDCLDKGCVTQENNCQHKPPAPTAIPSSLSGLLMLTLTPSVTLNPSRSSHSRSLTNKDLVDIAEMRQMMALWIIGTR